MKYKNHVIVQVGLFFLASCSNVSSTPTLFPNDVVILTETQIPEQSPTYSPDEIATLMARTYPTIPAHPNYPTPEIPDPNFYQTGMYLQDMYLGKYIIRYWSFNDDLVNTVTISTLNHSQIQITSDKIKFHFLSGSDVTGNETPDLILETARGQYNGTQVYDLGKTPELVLNIEGQFRDSFSSEFVPESSKFVDLDGNGSLEYIIPSFFWDTQELDLCFSPFNHLIFEFDKSKNKYIYATSKFYSYTMPTEITIDNEFKDEQDKFYSYCQLAINYAIFGDFPTSKLVLYNNLNLGDAEKAENIIRTILSRLDVNVP